MTEQQTPPVKRGRRILTIVGIVVLALVIVVCVAGYILLGISPVPETSSYQLDVAQLRQFATSGDGLLPVRLNALIVAEGTNAKTLVIAGGGFQNQRMVFPTFQVVYEDGMVVVDAVHTQAQHRQSFTGEPYDTAKYDAMQAAMRRSRTIIATHEHFDHIGGIANSPYFDEFNARVRLTAAQVTNARSLAGFPPALLARLTTFDYDGYYRLAPGMVLIKAPGHTPGGQMVYVRLQNGAEYLLVGDVVWNSESIDRLTGRPLLMNLSMNEDRAALGNEIRALYNLPRSEPIHLVVSHDGEQIEQYMRQGLLGRSFE
jgi:glyoxylase-like metal-dependent hydrolase (beta-lactamase superfamily II)